MVPAAKCRFSHRLDRSVYPDGHQRRTDLEKQRPQKETGFAYLWAAAGCQLFMDRDLFFLAYVFPWLPVAAAPDRPRGKNDPAVCPDRPESRKTADPLSDLVLLCGSAQF